MIIICRLCPWKTLTSPFGPMRHGANMAPRLVGNLTDTMVPPEGKCLVRGTSPIASSLPSDGWFSDDFHANRLI